MRPGTKVDIIAEIGINHDGDFQKAVGMIKSVATTGVKIVKFQHYDAFNLLGADSPYLAYANKCQFTKYEHERLKSFCDEIGLEYLVSVFDITDVGWANRLCRRHKVASRMNKNEPFIQALLDTGKEVIISTQDFNPVHLPTVRYMYCITKYPTPAAELENVPYSHQLGLSSHCPSIKPALEAVAKGANLIEQHVCLSRDEDGCDKPSSITIDELRQLYRFSNELEVIS